MTVRSFSVTTYVVFLKKVSKNKKNMIKNLSFGTLVVLRILTRLACV